jgi:hypothetical protein
MRQPPDVDLLGRRIGGQDLALDPPGLLGGIAQERLGGGDLALRLAQRLALLGDDHAGKKVVMLPHGIGQGMDGAAPLQRRTGGPGRLRLPGRVDRLGRDLRAPGGYARDDALIGRVLNLMSAFARPDPAPAHEHPRRSRPPFRDESFKIDEHDVRFWYEQTCPSEPQDSDPSQA